MLCLFLLLLEYLSWEWGARTWRLVLGEKIISQGLLQETPQMAIFELNIFFFPLFPFCDSCLECLGFLKRFATPHIGHHSSFLRSITHPSSFPPSLHYCSFRNVRLPSRPCTTGTLFFLVVCCALLHCHQQWKEKADLLEWQPWVYLTAAFILPCLLQEAGNELGAYFTLTVERIFQTICTRLFVYWKYVIFACAVVSM